MERGGLAVLALGGAAGDRAASLPSPSLLRDAGSPLLPLGGIFPRPGEAFRIAARFVQPALWTFCAIYDFSVKKPLAGLIFCSFSCKLKGIHAHAFFAPENPGAVQRIGNFIFK